MADKTGWNDYGSLVKQVAAQRVASMGPAAALAASGGSSVGDSSVGAYTRVGPSVYGPGTTPVHPLPPSQPDSGGGLNLGTPFSSAWHGLVEGINRAGSILPDIYHEQDITHQQREHNKDLNHNTFSLLNLLGDWGSAIGKGASEAVTGGRHSNFADVIQEHADVAKANKLAKSQGIAAPNFQDIKTGSAYVNPYLKGWLGAAGDIVANPINLIGAGTIAKGVEGIDALKGATEAEKALAGMKTAKLIAPVAKKQIALKLAGHEIPTGIPAVQLGARMAESSSPRVQKVLEAMRPVGNWINNPEFRSDVQAAKGSADALQHEYMTKTLNPVYRKFNAETQKSLLQQSLAQDIKHGDGDVLMAHGHIADLAKLWHDNKVSEDLYNHHVPKHLQFKAFDPKNNISALTEMLRVGREHSGGISNFLGNVHHGIQKAIEHQKIFDELPSQPAMRVPTKGASAEKIAAQQVKYDKNMTEQGFVKHKSPALAGRYIDKRLVPVVDRAENLLRARGQYMGNKWYARALDKSNSFVKKVDVGGNPASSIRRVISFTNQQILNGHFDPMMLQKAIAVNLRHHGLYRSLDDGGAIRALGGEGKFVKVGDERVPSADAFAELSKRGLQGNFTRSEVRSPEDIAGKGILRKGGHKFLEKMFNLNEHTDNTFRMATALHALKNAPKGLTQKQIYDYAMNEVRKTHLDFSGLTPFERKYMTRLMPFYAAISRSTPIAYRQLLANPGGASVLPLLQRDFGQSFNGQQGTGAIPSYLLRNAAVPAGIFKGQPVMMDQKNDITDAYQQFMGSNNPFKLLPQAASQLTPIAKNPAELVGGHSFFTGAPTRDKLSSLLNYFASQTPETNLASHEIKQNTPMKTRTGTAPMPTGKTSYPIDPTILKALTGFGSTLVTPRQQASAQKQQAKKKKSWFDINP